MIPLTSIRMVYCIFQFYLFSNLQHTFPPANTWKCSNPSMQYTSGGSYGYFSPILTRNLQFPPQRLEYSLPQKMMIHSLQSERLLGWGRIMARIEGSIFYSSQSSRAQMASSYQFCRRFMRSSRDIGFYYQRGISMGMSVAYQTMHQSPKIASSTINDSFVVCFLLLFPNNFTEMHRQGQPQPRGKTLSFNLPQIRPARSLPAIPPSKDFDLRLVNIHMPSYRPEKDKFLSQYFQRQNRIKTLPSSQDSQERPLKTEPSLHTLKRPQKSGEKATNTGKSKKWQQSAVPTATKTRTDNLKELSKQQFSSYLQSMKQKITQKALN